MATNTSQVYDSVIAVCKSLFLKKTSDYGTAWRILRPASITDQIFIKAQRIRTLEEKKVSKVAEDITSEYIGIVNYCVIAMIQLDLEPSESNELEVDRVEMLFDKKVTETKELMFAKNHDYGEAWRGMSQESFTDLILSKLLRIRQILFNKGKTIASEGIEANYHDIINYGLFALILIKENKHKG